MKIVFNGQEYPSLDAMPPEARKAYQQVMGMFADKDGNGVPDVFEGRGSDAVVIEQSSIVVNGQAYPGVEAMPADVRRIYEQAMGALAKSGGAAGAAGAAGTGGAMSLSAAVEGVSAAAGDAATQRGRGGSVGPRWGEEDHRGTRPGIWMLIALLLGAVILVMLV